MATRESTATRPKLNVSINRMTEHDLLEVCEIEEMSHLSTWGWEAYYKELESRQDTIMLVAKIESDFHRVEVAGFIVARVIEDELHVNNVAVRPEFRGAGIGSKLLRATLLRARELGAKQAWLEVRAGNEPAQALYRKCGFAVTGTRRNYYREPLEDALLMSIMFA